MEEVVLQTQWGWLVGLYLFLGGLAAGTLIVSAVISLRTKDKYKNTVRFGAWAGTILLIIGVLCLVAEVAMPLRALLLWESFINFSSWMTIGAWLLVAGVALAAVYACACTEKIAGKLKLLRGIRPGLAIAVIIVSLGIAIYTGVLLGVLVNRPLWNTWLLPTLFTVSALDTGVAIVSGFAVLRGLKEKAVGLEGGKEAFAKFKGTLEKSTIVLVILEVIVLAVFLITRASAGEVGSASVQLLTTGVLAAYFWILLVVCGLLVPLVISVILLRKPKLAEKNLVMPLVGIVLCLVGGCTLRFLVLLAGLPLYM